ncbi:MAG: hypothetical protein MJE77_46510 [Proteobacteria bacterium]|nr:hypothetical protein [Pseudomonadota bacterium]
MRNSAAEPDGEEDGVDAAAAGEVELDGWLAVFSSFLEHPNAVAMMKRNAIKPTGVRATDVLGCVISTSDFANIGCPMAQHGASLGRLAASLED